MNTISCVVFDFFDVVHTDHQKRWMQKHRVTQDQLAAANHLFDTGIISYHQLLTHMARASGSTSEEIHRELNELSALDHDVIDLIRTLRANNYQTCLLSNTASEVIRPLLAKHDLEQLFNHIIVSGEVGIRKPDRRIFELALSLTHRRPDETAFIDDSPGNIQAAQDLGIHAIHHTGNSRTLKKSLEQAGVITERS